MLSPPWQRDTFYALDGEECGATFRMGINFEHKRKGELPLSSMVTEDSKGLRNLVPHKKRGRVLPKVKERVTVSPDSTADPEKLKAMLDKRVGTVILDRDELRVTFLTGESLFVSFDGMGLMVVAKTAPVVPSITASKELLASGFAGVDANGKLVDIRKFPTAKKVTL